MPLHHCLWVGFVGSERLLADPETQASLALPHPPRLPPLPRQLLDTLDVEDAEGQDQDKDAQDQ